MSDTFFSVSLRLPFFFSYCSLSPILTVFSTHAPHTHTHYFTSKLFLLLYPVIRCVIHFSLFLYFSPSLPFSLYSKHTHRFCTKNSSSSSSSFSSLIRSLLIFFLLYSRRSFIFDKYSDLRPLQINLNIYLQTGKILYYFNAMKLRVRKILKEGKNISTPIRTHTERKRVRERRTVSVRHLCRWLQIYEVEILHGFCELSSVSMYLNKEENVPITYKISPNLEIWRHRKRWRTETVRRVRVQRKQTVDLGFPRTFFVLLVKGASEKVYVHGYFKLFPVVNDRGKKYFLL